MKIKLQHNEIWGTQHKQCLEGNKLHYALQTNNLSSHLENLEEQQNKSKGSKKDQMES